MKKYFLNETKFLALLFIILIGLSGCSAIDDEPEPEIRQETSQPPRNVEDSDYPQHIDNRPKEGVIRLRRHGPGYDVSMDINASDENISFLMDLPQQKQIDKLKKNIYASSKLLMDAQSLFYKKEYIQSLATIDTSIELAPDNPYAHALRGSILFKLQKTQDAAHAWQRALDLDPTLTDVSTTLKKLGIKE